MDALISVYLHPRLGEVTLSQSMRARRISISVRASGAVRLSFPKEVSHERALSFLDEKAGWVEAARERLARRQVSVAPEHLFEELRRAARADLPGRIARLSEATGLKYEKLKLSTARTRWGSCSGQNHISLSIFLMTLPEHLRDYIIIHELCHTVHHNHSPRFHALVDRMVGGREKALNRELRAFTIR